MTQQEKSKLLEDCHWKLKLAAHYAESQIGQPVTPSSMSTLMTLTTQAHAAVTNLRSLAAGNEPPKEG
jgi:hypothetical protein